jgi:hypothetical protein
MTKTMIAPIVAVIAIAIKALLGIEISAEIQEQIVTGVVILGAAGYSVYGIIKNHKKEGVK